MTDERVRALLGAAPLKPLVDRVEQRMRRGRPLTGQVVLAALGPAEQAAIAALVGRRIGTGSTASVRLEEVDRIIRTSGAAPGLAAAVTALRGPIPVATEEAARSEARRDAALAPLDALARTRPELARLAARLRRGGLLTALPGSAQDGARLVRDLVLVLRALPSPGETIAAFAARVLHSAHALDRGLLRSLVESVLDDLVDRPDEDDLHPAPPDPLERWAAVGIAVDSLASSVLVHAVRFAADEPLGAALNDVAEVGQPLLVTLRILTAGVRPAVREVFVCENPAVLIAAADRFGAGCAPILCVRGQPSAAAQRLLALLSDSGAILRYHGDFDWGGVRIANRIVERYGAEPWRFRTADLRAADMPGHDLAGQRVEAVWDSGLADAIEQRGSRLEEEQVLPLLLSDLAR